jgi:hypothetical protein
MREKSSIAEFDRVFAELKAILSDYEPRLQVVHDRAGYYYLDTHAIGPNGKPIMFGAVRVGKNYVSYYFMPVYGGILDGLSPALKTRMQGKACFNFTEVDKALFKDLKTLTKRGYAAWKKMEWVE